MISLVIPGAPVAKGRPRISTRGGFARAYTPAKTQRYEDLIRLEAGNVMGGAAPLDEPLTVVVTAFVAIPKGFSKRKRQDAIDGLVKPVTRPDIDNYIKAAFDGCNGIVFRDDSQISDLISRKRYSERPRLEIQVSIGEGVA